MVPTGVEVMALPQMVMQPVRQLRQWRIASHATPTLQVASHPSQRLDQARWPTLLPDSNTTSMDILTTSQKTILPLWRNVSASSTPLPVNSLVPNATETRMPTSASLAGAPLKEPY